jgi:polar amino acid transport system permease protein
VTLSPAQLERLAYRRRQTLFSVLVAALSTLVLGVLLVAVVTGAPGWDRVRESFLDPDVARDALPDVLRGLWLNIRLLFFCAIGALALGLAVALLRTLRGPVFFPVRVLATGYTYTFRGLPLIIVLYVLTLGVPGLRLQGMPSTLVLGGIALVVTYSGYLAEVFRAGIESVHPSQLAAARSLGLTYRQTMRFVVLPQGLRRMVPATVSQLITLNKDTTLVSIIAIEELARRGRILTSFNFFGGVQAPVLQVFIFIGLLFVIVNLLLSRLSRRLEIRERRRTGTTLRRVRGLEDQVVVEGERA